MYFCLFVHDPISFLTNEDNEIFTQYDKEFNQTNNFSQFELFDILPHLNQTMKLLLYDCNIFN